MSDWMTEPNKDRLYDVENMSALSNVGQFEQIILYFMLVNS